MKVRKHARIARWRGGKEGERKTERGIKGALKEAKMNGKKDVRKHQEGEKGESLNQRKR